MLLEPLFEIFLNFHDSSSTSSQSPFNKLRSAVLCKDRKRVIDLYKNLIQGSTKARVEFCERLLRIFEPLYFEQVKSELELMIKATDLISDDMVNISRDQVWSVKLKRVSRLLQISEPATFDSMFTSDIIVAPPVTAQVDSAYTSYYGATGTTSTISANNFVVLNLTAHLP